jgi:hypothetical protein
MWKAMLIWCVRWRDVACVACWKVDAMCWHWASLQHIIESNCDVARYFKLHTFTLVSHALYDDTHTRHVYIHTCIQVYPVVTMSVCAASRL